MKSLLVPFDHGKFVTLTNGYDDEDFIGQEVTPEVDEIRIYHAGLLNQLRNPIHLWAALNQLCMSNADIRSQLKIHLVGTIDPEVIRLIESYDQLKSKLVIEKYKSHGAVIQDYGRSDILLLLVNNSDNADANIPGKLFEYMASQKPILAMTAAGTDAHSILEAYAKSVCLPYSSPITEDKLELMKAFFLEAKSIYRQPSDYHLKFERKALTQKLVDLLKSIP
jgi:glycosyltransferase involved in cell wall biosynthesis